jgi:LruC domain-containing protein
MRTLLKTFSLAAALTALPALASDTDADGVLDHADAFPCDPLAAAAVFAPAEGQHGMLLFEDRWPADGDLDFNDAALTYNYVLLLDGQGRVTSLQLSLNVLAVGAALSNDVWLRLPVPRGLVASVQRNTEDGVSEPLALADDETDAVFRLVANPHSLFPVHPGFANTEPTAEAMRGKPQNFLVRFAVPVALDVAEAPFDLFLARTDDVGHQIHLPQYGGTDRMDRSLFGTQNDASSEQRHFVNGRGLPFALHMPQVIAWPREYMSLDSVYPEIGLFAVSGGQEGRSWYTGAMDLERAYLGGTGESYPPMPVIVGPSAPTADRSCVGWNGTVQFGGTQLSVMRINSDAQANVLVAGSTPELGQGSQAYVAKLDPSNAVLWARTFGTASEDQAFRVAADAAGNIYVAGITWGNLGGTLAGSADVFVRKFDAAGNSLWTRQLGTSSYESVTGLAVTPEGAVFLAGHTDSPEWSPVKTALTRPFAARIDESGALDWVKAWDAFAGSYSSAATAASLDASGELRVLVRGLSYSGGRTQYEHATVALSPAGAQRWSAPLTTTSYDSYGGAFRSMTDLAVDASGASVASGSHTTQYCYTSYQTYCYWTGSVFNRYQVCSSYPYTTCGGASSGVLEKVGAAGSREWERYYSSAPSSTVSPQGVMLSADGSIYVAGLIRGALSGTTSRGDWDAYLARFDASGNPLWARQDGTDKYDGAFGVCAAREGVYIGGVTDGTLAGATGQGRGFVAKYDEAGNRL